MFGFVSTQSDVICCRVVLCCNILSCAGDACRTTGAAACWRNAAL